MKNFKKSLVLLLVAVMAIGLLCGCESTEEKMAALSGTWTMTADDSAEQAQILVESIELYPEEIALVDLTSLDYVKTVTFDADGNYSFGYDVDATKECVRQFYLGMFDALYEGRTTLNAAYEQEFDNMSRDDFNQFYADLYSVDSYDALIELFAENAYNYEVLAEPTETGTYTIKGKFIMCTITGETEAESLGYTLEGSTLTLLFADAQEVYTK